MIYRIEMSDGSIRIMDLTKGTPAENIAKWEEDGLEVLSVEVLIPEDLPGDRILRNAWCIKDGKIDLDHVKCQQMIREKRDKALEVLDLEATAELRRPGGDTTIIDAKAKTLRDIPQEDLRFISGDSVQLKELYVELLTEAEKVVV